MYFGVPKQKLHLLKTRFRITSEDYEMYEKFEEWRSNWLMRHDWTGEFDELEYEINIHAHINMKSVPKPRPYRVLSICDLDKKNVVGVRNVEWLLTKNDLSKVSVY